MADRLPCTYRRREERRPGQQVHHKGLGRTDSTHWVAKTGLRDNRRDGVFGLHKRRKKSAPVGRLRPGTGGLPLRGVHLFKRSPLVFYILYRRAREQGLSIFGTGTKGIIPPRVQQMLCTQDALSFKEREKRESMPFPQGTGAGDMASREGQTWREERSGAAARRGRSTVLDHGQSVAALAAGPAAQFVHEGPHEEDAPAADA